VDNKFEIKKRKIYVKIPDCFLEDYKTLLLFLFSNKKDSFWIEEKYLPETYSDEDFNLKEFRKARRTLDAIYNIVNTYFENISLKDILLEVLFLINESKAYIIMCSDIRKLVFHKDCYNLNKNNNFKEFLEENITNYRINHLRFLNNTTSHSFEEIQENLNKLLYKTKGVDNLSFQDLDKLIK
jgi:hypothetical protein